jgi:G3E family GTPase
MRVHVICGFLGSGKTTLMRRVLMERAGRERLAVIVNELGEVGIDGAILEGHNVSMIEITSGCFCCTLKGSLLSAVEELRDQAGVERIVIEASGVAHPGELVEVLADPAVASAIELGPIITVVDAPKFPILRRVLGKFYTTQVERGDVVLLNKMDLAKPGQLEAVQREVAGLNPRAAVIVTERCEVELSMVLDGRNGGMEPSALDQGLASPAPAASFVSFVLVAGFDADRAKVERFFGGLPANVVRAKGFVTIEGEPRLVQFSAGQLEITPAEGPRVFKVVFIGMEPDRATIEAEFARTSRR